MVTRKRKGITIVELLLALSLCVIMIGAITGVLSSLREQQRKRFQHMPNHWQGNYHRILWTDLSQARWIAKLDAGMALAIPPNSIVTYEVSTLGSGPGTLVRRSYGSNAEIRVGQALSTLWNSDLLQSQTITWTIDSVEFLRGDSNGNTNPIPGTWSPAPSSILYRIRKPSSDATSAQWVIVR